jgi:hypothetical protein
MLLSRCLECETSSAIGLDSQLLYQINIIKPGLLVRIDDLPQIKLGSSVHPWVQAPMRDCLIRALAKRPDKTLTINSAYRTIVGQQLLRSHFENGRCGIPAAAPPGRSNHNNASAIDIENPQEWLSALESSGFYWLKRRIRAEWMHFDCVDRRIIDMRSISIRAFQQLHSLANPGDRLSADGDLGQLTANRLRNAPIYGFGNLPTDYPQRILRLTDPLQAGKDVGELQLSLRAAGIEVEKADKIFGKGTDQAVKEYQAKSGLKADGIVGKVTLMALEKPRSADVA